MMMYDDLDEIIRPRFQTSVQKNFDTSWTCSMCGTYMIHTCSKKHTLCTNESKKLVSGPATWSAWLTYLRTHQVHKKYVYTYIHTRTTSIHVLVSFSFRKICTVVPSYSNWYSCNCNCGARYPVIVFIFMVMVTKI